MQVSKVSLGDLEIIRAVRAVVVAVVVTTGIPIASAQADEEKTDLADLGKFSVGVSAGTLGIGGEIAVKMHPNFILRGTASTWSLNSVASIGNDTSFAVPGNSFSSQHYGYTSSVTSAGLLLDIHAFRDGGRMTTGVRYLAYDLDGTIINKQDVNFVKVGGTVYTKAQAGVVTAKVTNGSTILPYAGIGYDASFFKQYGLSLSLDAGVIVGSKPQAKVSTTGAGVSQTDRLAEQKKVETDVAFLRYYPVVMLSAKYRF